MRCMGVRGATTVEENTAQAILKATRQLLWLMIRANGIEAEDVASTIFTTTLDLNATFPATAARQLGWLDQALMCGHEMDVPGALGKCIRVLVLWNTDKKASEIVHVYLKGARSLRPDRNDIPPIPPEELHEWVDWEEGIL